MAEASFFCTECGHSLEVDENLAGEEITCPSCSKQIEIPFATSTATDDAQKGFFKIWNAFLKR